MKELDLVEDFFQDIGRAFSPEIKKQLIQYLDLLCAWNSKINLVSRFDKSNLIKRHVLESLLILEAIDFPDGSKIVDVGSGGGFPGIPLSICCSKSHFSLVESKRKKTLFLKEVVSQLDLKNVDVHNDRLEKFVEVTQWQQYFDFGLSRAVADLDVVFRSVKNLLKPQGVYVAWKGGNIQSEIENIKSEFSNIFIKTIQMNERYVNKNLNRCFVAVFRKQNGGI